MEEFLKPMALSQNRMAIEIGVPARRINEIVLGKRRISADTALRLGRYFEMSPQFWLGLQMDYDLDIEADKLGARLEREVRPLALSFGWYLLNIQWLWPVSDRVHRWLGRRPATAAPVC